MFTRLFSIFIIHCLICTSVLSFAQENKPENGLVIYQKLKDLELDETKVAEVKGFILKRDVGIFNLQQGKIYLFKPVLGKVTGAVFIGEGIFDFSPPTEIEKYQLEKFTKKRALNDRFSELYLRFMDSTAEELGSKLQFVPGEIPGKAKSIKEDSENRAFKELYRNLNARVLEDLLFEPPAAGSNWSPEFFYADIDLKEDKRVFFTFDTKSIEEVSLWREAPSLPLAERVYDLVCSFHRESDYKEGNPEENVENKDEIVPKHYKMEVKIENNGTLTATCELTFVPLIDGIRVIPFQIHAKSEDILKDVEVDSIMDQIIFIAEKDQYGLSAIFPYPLQSDQETKLSFNYRCDFLDLSWSGLFFVKSTAFWYPRYGFRPRTTFDLTFKVPKALKFVSVGEKNKEWTEGDYRCSHWLVNFPASYISFNLGYFDIYKQKVQGLPEVSVYWNEDFHERYTQAVMKEATEAIAMGAHMKEKIAADVINSLNFFQNYFGSFPFDHIAVTEIPYEHGQASSGLLHLSWATFLEEKKFEEESFRAHEVAHQWWGHMVNWNDYHDQWLSEGFAEYSGAWYAQLSLKDNKKFFEELRFWKDNILGKDTKKIGSKGSKAGPLWLGARLNSSKSQDRSALIYEKGAFILHMLRNMMMDFSNFSDLKFIAMLQDYVKTYYGKDATTTDFKNIVEKHMGQDMDWFFDQWVYGIEIPKYIYSYTTEKAGDKYAVTVKVRQENVSPNFKMQVPVVVVYKKEGYSVFRIWVDQPSVEVKLSPVPMEVKEVVINPYESVLCEAEKE